MHRVVAITWTDQPWTNVELRKDIGMVPFLFHRNHGCDVKIVTGPGEDYPYLGEMEGLNIEILPDNSLETKFKWLEENGKDIDLLMLYGVTIHNIYMAPFIKSVNPNCKVTCALDMNVEFADRIPFYESPYKEFFESIDMMWQSGSTMTDFLNEKWYWKVECAINGYYDLKEGTSDVSYVPYEERNNTILCVGRINNGPKASEILLNSFASIADEIPDWSLKLVGTIEHPFEEYIETFFYYYPQLVDRVIFAGNINDKDVLHREYEMAKIYASSTRFEGGPNAVAEAVCAGDVIAITQIEASKDFIGDNESGMSVPIDDAEGFARMLLELCTKCDLKKMSSAAYERGKKLFRLDVTVGELYGKLCDKGF